MLRTLKNINGLEWKFWSGEQKRTAQRWDWRKWNQFWAGEKSDSKSSIKLSEAVHVEEREIMMTVVKSDWAWGSIEISELLMHWYTVWQWCAEINDGIHVTHLRNVPCKFRKTTVVDMKQCKSPTNLDPFESCWIENIVEKGTRKAEWEVLCRTKEWKSCREYAIQSFRTTESIENSLDNVYRKRYHPINAYVLALQRYGSLLIRCSSSTALHPVPEKDQIENLWKYHLIWDSVRVGMDVSWWHTLKRASWMNILNLIGARSSRKGQVKTKLVHTTRVLDIRNWHAEKLKTIRNQAGVHVLNLFVEHHWREKWKGRTRLQNVLQYGFNA